MEAVCFYCSPMKAWCISNAIVLDQAVFDPDETLNDLRLLQW